MTVLGCILQVLTTFFSACTAVKQSTVMCTELIHNQGFDWTRTVTWIDGKRLAVRHVICTTMITGDFCELCENDYLDRSSLPLVTAPCLHNVI